jgi:hypothetical protein
MSPSLISGIGCFVSWEGKIRFDCGSVSGRVIAFGSHRGITVSHCQKVTGIVILSII